MKRKNYTRVKIFPNDDGTFSRWVYNGDTNQVTEYPMKIKDVPKDLIEYYKFPEEKKDKKDEFKEGMSDEK